MIFDVLWYRGTLRISSPHCERRALLESLGLSAPHIQVPPVWTGAPEHAVEFSRTHRLEGAVLKRLDSPYLPGKRGRAWLKLKNTRTLDVVIGGWVPAGPGGVGLKALLVGTPGQHGLDYLGAVGTGFADAERHALAALMKRLETDEAPFADGGVAAKAREHSARWVRPQLAAEIEYLELTQDAHLRHPVWRGLRATY